MNKLNLSHIARGLKAGFRKHSPELLMGLGIGGMLVSTILAVKETPKALERLEEKKKEENRDELTVKEVIETAGPCYIPAAVTTAVSVACLVGASSEHSKRNAALAAAYTISESAFKEYQDKVIDIIGEEKEKEVKKAVDKDRVEKNPPPSADIIAMKPDNVLCYDGFCGGYFTSNMDQIEKAINRLNYRLRDEMQITLNEFYDELDRDPVPIGDRLGWDVDYGFIDATYSTQLTPDGRPCLVVNYSVPPLYFK